MLERGIPGRRQTNIWFLNRIVGTFSLAFTLSAGLALVPVLASAQSEDQVKAAFLFNFVRYVDWPTEVFEDDASNVNICMLGADAFASVVTQTVSGKSVGDRKVKVESIQSSNSATDCHLLYLGSSMKGSFSDVFSELGNAPIFTVSDAEGFAEAGGMANFFRSNSKMRFEINPGAAKEAKLKISSRLLRLARVVK